MHGNTSEHISKIKINWRWFTGLVMLLEMWWNLQCEKKIPKPAHYDLGMNNGVKMLLVCEFMWVGKLKNLYISLPRLVHLNERHLVSIGKDKYSPCTEHTITVQIHPNTLYVCKSIVSFKHHLALVWNTEYQTGHPNAPSRKTYCKLDTNTTWVFNIKCISLMWFIYSPFCQV
jgi:hypothetical protein